ncbi:MAG: hypothetical protein ACTHQ3_22310 [Motilibacteraceae bacterium]
MTGVVLTLLHPAGRTATAQSLAGLIARRRPGLVVRLAQAAAAPSALAGVGGPSTVLVPLDGDAAMLEGGASVREGGAVLATLAGHPLLAGAAERRLREAGVWPGDPDFSLVVTGWPERDRSGELARRWAAAGWQRVLPVGAPTEVVPAVNQLCRGGARRVAVARLDVVGAPLPALPAGVPVAAPLGSCEEVARAVLARFDAALPALAHAAA